MNTEKIIKELLQRYPGKKIIKNDEENPTEILCEVDPAENGLDAGMAIAVIDKSKRHYHKKSREIYEVIRGKLIINKDGQDLHLKETERLTIEPGEIHFAVGNETWVKVYSEPGWAPEDHILVE